MKKRPTNAAPKKKVKVKRGQKKGQFGALATGVLITEKGLRCEGSGQQYSLQVIRELRHKL